LLQAAADFWLLPRGVAKRLGLLALFALGGWAAACTPSAELEGGLGPSGQGTLSIAIDGLPAGAAAAVLVESALGYQHSLSGPEQLAQLAAGSYQLTAQDVVVGGDRYVAAPASQTVTLGKGSTQSVHIAYVLATARLRISLSGVPSGASAALALAGPGGYQQVVSGSTVLSGLAPGTYSIGAPVVVAGGDRYQTQPEVLEAVLPAPDTIPVAVAVHYALASGRLVLQLSGVPEQAVPAIHVSGPGLDQFITRADTLVGLLPALYSVSAANVVSGGATYAPLAEGFSVVVSADSVPAVAQVAYALATGELQVSTVGLPAGAGGSISVTGPGGFAQLLSGSQLLGGLLPGTYTIAAGPASLAGQLYVPSPSLQTRLVNPGLVPAQAEVSYALATASLTVTVSGLPAGVSAGISLSGPGGYSAALSGSNSLSGLATGAYHLVAAPVNTSGTGYAAQPAVQDLTLSAGQSFAVSVSYAAATGALSVSILGLPGNLAALVTVSGPAGYSHGVTVPETLMGLAPGSYTVGASAVSGGGFSYTPAPATQAVTVVAGAVANAALSYAVSGGGLDLTINGAYLTQAVQRYDGTVPLVAGRDAYLRVFALANQANSAQPQIRVRLYNAGTLLQTYTLAAPAASVPLLVDESSLMKSWNVLVPGALVQPGLRLLADVDPANSVAEMDESNNQFPVSGVAAGVDVRALPTFALRLVPILQQVNGLQGDVTGANQEAYLSDLKRMLPVGAYDAEVRAPYTTTAPALQGSNANSAWNTILSELLALRSADASARYYYGVVKVSYGSGVAGLGYVGGNAHAAIGWDYLPSAANVMAHEVGHNLGRWHAPCGGAGQADPSYPYSSGQIGVWGLDVAALALKAPSAPDLMGYCGPNWVSDYNWSGMVGFRQSGPNNAPDAGAGAGATGLLIWGRVGASGVVLEPAFRVRAAPDLLPRSGPNRLELLGADGSLLRSVAFETAEVADLPAGSERAFAFVLPLDARDESALASLRVSAQGRTATRVGLAGSADPGQSISRPNPQQIELRWDAARFPMVLVRDAASGQVLSLARGGVARIWTRSQDFELQFSGGLRSVSRAARVLR